ncbi:MAG: hypothetical protein KatS3mg121_1499 [Gammaproteobacteria bacterium]|nr:MAG: hypothetical protein KatS3mg121_1499 [Gammaproteobacteria bacterium]
MNPFRGYGAALQGASLLIALGMTSACAGEAPPQTTIEDPAAGALRVTVLARDLEHPWGMAFLPEGGALVTERPGRLRRLDANWRLDPEPIAGLPEIAAVGQGGLLDVALHPRFAENRRVYLSYAAAGDGGVGTEVAYGRLVDGRLQDLKVIFRARPKVEGGRHFGSRLLFLPDGHLLITLGDRGQREQAQSLAVHLGKTVRLTDEGAVPQDNPFAGREDALPEIYSLGHRNIQGATLAPDGTVWLHEHGPQGGDELNRLVAGGNYGWPVVTFGVEYGTGRPIGEGTHKPGMIDPVHVWVPSIAPSGLAHYGDGPIRAWRGQLLVGALKFMQLVRLALDADGRRVVDEVRLLDGRLGRIRDVRVGPDGLVYLLTDHPRGVLARIEPLPAD